MFYTLKEYKDENYVEQIMSLVLVANDQYIYRYSNQLRDADIFNPFN